jgi:hypothetical protein
VNPSFFHRGTERPSRANHTSRKNLSGVLVPDARELFNFRNRCRADVAVQRSRLQPPFRSTSRGPLTALVNGPFHLSANDIASTNCSDLGALSILLEDDRRENLGQRAHKDCAAVLGWIIPSWMAPGLVEGSHFEERLRPVSEHPDSAPQAVPPHA